MSDTPSAMDQLRSAASEVLDGDALESFMTYAPVEAYTGEDGQIDKDRVMGHLTTLYVSRAQRNGTPNWGQSSAGGAPSQQPGDHGRNALEKRHGVPRTDEQRAAGTSSPRGQKGRAALQRRHGVDQR